MKALALAGAVLAALTSAVAQECTQDQIEANKAIALGFYQDLWFTDNTDRYHKYVAETYKVWDIGERKNVTEPAIEQKIIADRFHDNGTMTGEIQYMVADCERVATRWVAISKGETLMGKLMMGGELRLPIINVVRIEDGKIIEFWNHRHDIDTPMTMRFTAKGFLIGLVVGLVPAAILAFRRRNAAAA
ncbi:MAG: ester cyclase [Pseudomonadota bacterium]